MLYGYEWKKIWGNRIFWILFIGLIFLQIFIFYQNNRTSYPYLTSSYQLLYQDLQRQSPEKALFLLERRLSFLEAQEAVIPGEERVPLSKWQLYYTGNEFLEIQLLRDVKNEVSAMLEYGKYLDKIKKRAGNMGEISLFSKGKKGFRQRNIEKTAMDFQGQKEFSLEKLQSGRGIERALSFPLTDVFLIILFCYFSYLMVYQDREKHLELYVHTAPEGRMSLLRAKVVSVILGTILMGTIFFLMNLFLAYLIYGFGDWSRPIQSIVSYESSILKVSTGGFVLLCFAGKMLWYITLALLTLLLAYLIRKEFIFYGVVAGIYGIGGILYSFIPENSIWQILKYWNVFYLLKIDSIFGKYLNLNLGGYPIPITFCFWVLGIFVFLGSFLCLFLFMRRKYISNRETLGRETQIFQCRSTRLFVYECYKLMRVYKIWIIFALFLLFQFYGNYNRKIFLTSEEMAYRSYVVELEGDVSTDRGQEKMIKKEELRFQKMREKLEKEGKDSIKGRKLSQKLQMESSFRQVKSRFFELKDQSEKMSHGSSLIFEKEYELLIHQERQDIKNGMLLVILLIVTMIGMISIEYKAGMIPMISSFYVSGGKWIKNKILMAVLIGTIDYSMVYFPDFFISFQNFPLKTLNVPIASIRGFAGWNSVITIKGYLILMMGARYIGMICLVLFLLGIGAKAKNLLTAFSFSTIFLIVPYILYYVGVRGASHIGIVPFLSGNLLFLGGNSVLTASILFGLLVGCLGLWFLIRSRLVRRD